LALSSSALPLPNIQAVIPTTPWVSQLILTMAIIILYKVGDFDYGFAPIV